MAYHIFTLRKLMLTNRMNSINSKMMNVQFQREEVEDQLLSLWNEFYGFNAGSTTDGIDLQTIEGEAGVKLDKELTDQEKNRIKLEIHNAQALENRLDQLIKKYETQYSEAQNELKSVETQEGQGIQMSVPKYSGAGGQ